MSWRRRSRLPSVGTRQTRNPLVIIWSGDGADHSSGRGYVLLRKRQPHDRARAVTFPPKGCAGIELFIGRKWRRTVCIEIEKKMDTSTARWLPSHPSSQITRGMPCTTAMPALAAGTGRHPRPVRSAAASAGPQASRPLPQISLSLPAGEGGVGVFTLGFAEEDRPRCWRALTAIVLTARLFR